MSIKAVLFDLDGTLLPMDQELFTKAYFKGLAAHLAPLGYEPQALIDAIWKGTIAMIKNDGAQTNEVTFWNAFAGIFGEKVRHDEPEFDKFYRTGFSSVKDVCGFSQKAAEIVHSLRKQGIKVVLATNPIFPRIATENRMRWAGLEPSDFEFFTTYENTSYCKPNLSYYKDIVSRLGVAPHECIMVGNDVGDDMIAKELGMKVFLLTDNLINKDGVDISQYPNGNFDELCAYIQKAL